MKVKARDVLNYSPYTLKRSGMLWWTVYRVQYEECDILILSGQSKLAKSIVAMLNAAYREGMILAYRESGVEILT